jgi:hypothetical protein
MRSAVTQPSKTVSSENRKQLAESLEKKLEHPERMAIVS